MLLLMLNYELTPTLGYPFITNKNSKLDLTKLTLVKSQIKK